MSTYEQGRADATNRKKASSIAPEYKGGYLDGLFDRSASTATASFRDNTISGMVIEALANDAGASYSVRLIGGNLVCTGSATDIESAIAAAESDIVSLGHLTVRVAQIEATISRLHPEMAAPEVRRLASKTAQYILEHARGTNAA